jgi:hypothetical protein
LPDVLQPVITEVLGSVSVQVGATPFTGGPVVPCLTALVPDRLPLVLPLDGMVVIARGVQLTGMSLPR